ncbi:MAG TPA: DUF4188 domain-containing protein [Rhizomicrobium sp.]|nr:DUF4188 domain-containing protein [Rhizomicrobium sp.]
MSKVFDGRFTARIEKPVVLFLIGMRINKPLAVGKWWPVTRAMPRMLAELEAKPGSGLLWHRTYVSPPVVMVQQYWNSFDELLAYAHDKSAAHFPAWAEFNRRVGNNGAVGIWHETYLVEPSKFETLYGNMPLFGLAAAGSHVKAEGRLAAAKDRFSAAA